MGCPVARAPGVTAGAWHEAPQPTKFPARESRSNGAAAYDKEVAMSMEGQGPEGQPSEGVATLTDLVGLMDGGEEGADTLEESDEGEESEESEGSETEEEESDESEEDDSEPKAKKKRAIKHDGKDVELELTDEEETDFIQKGFDYTKKTMALGEEREAVKAEREEVRTIQSEVRQRREQAINDLQVVQHFMEQQLGDPPDVSLAAHDVSQYVFAKELYEGQRAKLHQVAQALHQMRQQQEAEQASQRKQRLDKVERELIDSLPGWKEAPAEKFKEVADYVESLGLTPADVGEAVATTGFWQLVHKAREYDRLLSEKAKLKPVQSLPKVTKPGNNNQPPQLAKRQEALKRHKANPSMKSLADLL